MLGMQPSQPPVMPNYNGLLACWTCNHLNLQVCQTIMDYWHARHALISTSRYVKLLAVSMLLILAFKSEIIFNFFKPAWTILIRSFSVPSANLEIRVRILEVNFFIKSKLFLIKMHNFYCHNFSSKGPFQGRRVKLTLNSSCHMYFICCFR